MGEKTLEKLRAELDDVDRELLKQFVRRMELCRAVGNYKRQHALPVYDPARERRKLEDIAEITPPELETYALSLYEELFRLSRTWQGENT